MENRQQSLFDGTDDEDPRARKQVIKQKKITEKSVKLVKCISCRNAYLMQRQHNPVISQCEYHGRNVANFPRVCKDYMFNHKEAEIHEMICLP